MLIFDDGLLPAADRGGRGGFGGAPDDVPPEYRDQVGRITVEKTVPELKRFVAGGGRLITIGSSATAIARHLDLPVEGHLVERSPDGTDTPLPRDKFYVPGSLLEVAVNRATPAAAGADSVATVMFDNNPVFRLPPDATMRGVTPIAWFQDATPLRSGWAHGEGYLQDGVAMARADVGKGRVYLYGPEITFRGQPAGTYRFLFNPLFE